MRIFIIIMFYLISWNSRKDIIYDLDFVNYTIDRIYYLKSNKIDPAFKFGDTIYKAIMLCPEEIHSILIAIHQEPRSNEKSLAAINYFNLNYDIIANIFIQHYFTDPVPKVSEFNVSYLIQSKIFIPIYYKHLTNKKAIWGKLIFYPLDYCRNFSELPTPTRYCDLALDGLIYAKYNSKIDYYQKIIPIDSLNFKITPRVDGRYEAYYRYIPIISKIRDSIIHEILQGKELR